MTNRINKHIFTIDLNDTKSIDASIERIDRARERLKSIPDIMQIARMQFVRQDIRLFLEELKKTGRLRRPGEKVRWTSEKQRRFVMRLLGGKKYVRKNQLIGSWVVRVRRLDLDKSLFFLTNRKPWVRFVVGAWGATFSQKDIKYYEHFQQGFHADMEWPLAWKPIKAASEKFEERHRVLIQELFDSLFD